MSAGWMVAILTLWVVVILVLVLLLGFLKRALPILEHAEQLVLDHGGLDPRGVLGTGDVIPDNAFSSLGDMKRPAILLFVSNDCRSCGELLTQITHAGQGLELPHLNIISDAALPARYQESLAGIGIRTFVQDRDSAPAALRHSVLPAAYAVDESSVVIGNAVPASLRALQELSTWISDQVKHPANGTGPPGRQEGEER